MIKELKVILRRDAKNKNLVPAQKVFDGLTKTMTSGK